MPTIIATAGGASANSYGTLAEAIAYLTDNRLNSSTWLTSTTTIQETSLIMGTNLLEVYFDWHGSVASTTQRLRLPRYGLRDRDFVDYASNAIPEIVKHALFELANDLVKRDRLAEPELATLGISQARVDVLSVTIDPKIVERIIPPHVVAMLRPIASPRGEERGGAGMIKLFRT